MRSLDVLALGLSAVLLGAGCAQEPAAAPPTEGTPAAKEEVAEVVSEGQHETPKASPKVASGPDGTKKRTKPPVKRKGGLPKDLPRSPAIGAEGLEARGLWGVAGWANPAEVALTSENGNGVLRLRGKAGGEHGKVAISSRAGVSLSAKGKGAVWIYNPGKKSVKIAFAVFVGEDRVYYESKTVEVGRGWKRAEWNLAASNYKCESSKWEHTAALWKPDEVKEMVLLIYEPGGFDLAIDGVSFDLAPPKPKPEAVKKAADPILKEGQADKLKGGLSDEDKAKIRKLLEEIDGE